MGSFKLQSIADFDAARARRAPAGQTTVTARPDLTPGARLRLALDVLQYNQDFVGLTDAKANTLLLVNSIFLATTASAGLHSGLGVASLLAAALVVLLCLGVVWARSTQPKARERGQLVFFGHIVRRRTPAAYEEDFCQAGPEELVSATARQVYELAGVVERKFKAYRWAQMATVVSAGLWISHLLVPVLG